MNSDTKRMILVLGALIFALAALISSFEHLNQKILLLIIAVLFLLSAMLIKKL